VYDTWESVAQTLERGEPLSTRQQTMMRLAMANITWTCKDVADFVYKCTDYYDPESERAIRWNDMISCSSFTWSSSIL